MSSIGDLEFDIMRGIPQSLKQETDTWRVPGLDGYGAQTLGLGDAEFELTTVVYIFDFDNNITAANDVVIAAEALQGTVVDLVDDWGDEYDGLLLKHVDTNGSKKPCIYKGDANAIRVEIRWQMMTVVVT